MNSFSFDKATFVSAAVPSGSEPVRWEGGSYQGTDIAAQYPDGVADFITAGVAMDMEPYMYDEDCFESICYRNATLQVPASSVERYRGIYPWSRFYNIIGYNETAGDVNADGEVNIADINAVIDQILSANYTESGDVNGDHEVNIADINAIIDMILSH